MEAIKNCGVMLKDLTSAPYSSITEDGEKLKELKVIEEKPIHKMQ